VGPHEPVREQVQAQVGVAWPRPGGCRGRRGSRPRRPAGCGSGPSAPAADAGTAARAAGAARGGAVEALDHRPRSGRSSRSPTCGPRPRRAAAAISGASSRWTAGYQASRVLPSWVRVDRPTPNAAISVIVRTPREGHVAARAYPRPRGRLATAGLPSPPRGSRREPRQAWTTQRGPRPASPATRPSRRRATVSARRRAHGRRRGRRRGDGCRRHGARLLGRHRRAARPASTSAWSPTSGRAPTRSRCCCVGPRPTGCARSWRSSGASSSRCCSGSWVRSRRWHAR
jgi:hypothetical protein